MDDRMSKPCRICGDTFGVHSREGCTRCAYCGGFEPKDTSQERSTVALERVASALEDSAAATWASVYVAVLQSPEVLQRGDEDMLGEIEAIAIRALLAVKAQQTDPSARAADGGDADARP